MSSSISLPLVVWHNFANPTITSVICSFPNVYAGQKDGHIWVYSMTRQPASLQHKFLLVGHKAPVVALCIVKTEKTDILSSTEDILISASEDGEIMRWSASDGRCLATNPNGFFGVPRQLKLFHQFSDRHIFCCGQTNEICILNATTLEVVRVWGGHPNWVTCTDFYDTGSNRARLVTITMEGRLDVWDFDTSRHIIVKDRTVINQPQLPSMDGKPFDAVFDLVSSKYAPGLCMVLTSGHVIIFALHNSEFVPQITIPAEKGCSWAGGAFSQKGRFVIWAQDGTIYEYRLKPPQGVQPGTMASRENQLYYSSALHRSFRFKRDTPHMPGTWVTSLSHSITDGEVVIETVTFCNKPTNSTFYIHTLSQAANGQETDVLCTGTGLADIWPQTARCSPEDGCITASTPVSTNHLAIGYENGTIRIVPLALALLHLTGLSQRIATRSDVRVFEKAHDGMVTCMTVQESHKHQYLVSGGRDGAVKIWNLNDGKYVASFSVHALPVKSFIEPVEQADSRIRGCVVSMAKDNSLAFISVDSMTCLFVFPGHAYPLSTIQWRTAEDYLVFGYSDESAYVWQISTGHLDRVLTGKTFKDVMEDDRWPVNHVLSLSAPTKQQAAAKSVVTPRALVSVNNVLQTSCDFAHVFTVNIRRLVHELYSSIDVNPEISGFVAPVPQKSTSSTSYDAVVPDNVNFQTDADPLDQPIDGSDGEDIDPKSLRATELLKKMELVSAIMSVSISWHVNESFQDICSGPLTLCRSVGRNISFGLKGANGCISILAPLADEKDAWKVSQTMTASRLLSTALLAKVIIFIAGQESKSADLISGYAMALPAVIGQGYCFPSLSLLSKFWQDPSARSLFSSAVTGLSNQDILELIDYWENYLPTSPTSDSHGPQMMARATIVLGIMGCDLPQMLNTRVRKSTALSLALLLSDSDLDEPKGAQAGEQNMSSSSIARTMASMELLSQGFTTWESYINVSEILRTMFMYATGAQPNISRGAKNAISTIADTNMTLVISTLTYDTVHTKKTNERIRCLRITSFFIRKRSVLLYSHIPRVVEAVVKSLDPNIPHLREAVLPTVTTVLHDLVKTYPIVDFSSSSQKLSVGTQEGAAVIYDLRTATRSIVLEGHTGPVVALAFSPDAKYIATCSLRDQTVRVWYPNLSLFGVLASSFSHSLKHDNHDTATSGSQKPYKVFSFALPNPQDEDMDQYEAIRNVRFNWPSSKCVKLHVRDLVMSFNV